MTLILKGEYGSRAYGTDTVDSDHDLVEVVIEPKEYVTGLSTWDTKQNSTAGDGNRSTRGDTDTTVYGLHKFVSLAAEGNPSVLSVLFLPEYDTLSASGQLLIDNRDLFVSKNAGKKFLGYMRGQRDAMLGVRNKRTNRPELIHKHGWDTKFGMHAVRLGYLGLELMTTEAISLPMTGKPLQTCRDIRQGIVSKEAGLAIISALEESLETAIKLSTLPDRSDGVAISEIMHIIYLNEWVANEN